MIHKITIDNTVIRTSKPHSSEMGRINNNIKTVVEISNQKQLSDLLVEKGYTWSPAIFSPNKRNNKNWLQQSMFVLDFDDGITPEEILERCKRNGLHANLIHSTFSDSKELRKFRLILFLDEVITDRKECKFIQNGLMLCFSESDQACSDYSRVYHGGPRVISTDETTNKKEFIIDLLNTFVIAKNGDKNKTRGILKNDKKCGLSVPLLDSITNNRDMEKPQKKVQHFNYEKVSKEVKILDDFIKGKWLYHNEIFGLATNLYHVECGLKFMIDIMVDNNNIGKTNYTENNLACISYIRKVKYKPMDLSNYSPYKEDHKHKNILYINHWHKGKIEIISKHKKLTLMEAENKLQQEFNRVLKEDNNKIYIFKTATGLGKTRLLENLKNTLIALPTHKLKDELVDRMKHNEFKVISKLPRFDTETLNESITDFYKNNLPLEVTKLLQKLVGNRLTVAHNETDIKLAGEYLSNLASCKTSYETVLTTHIRAIHGSDNHNTIVFDEDPVEQLLNIDKIMQHDVDAFKCSESNESITAVIDWLELKGNGIFEPLRKFNFSYSDLLITAHKIRKPKLLRFLKSLYMVRDDEHIHYINRTDLPINKKVIIMSVTASIPIYKHLYGDRLEVISIEDVEVKGQIIQHTKLSCSRTGLDSYHHIIDELVGDLPTITFKNYKKYFKNAIKNMHFNNCSGYDELNGKDIAVIGTDHKPNLMYIFYGLALGIKFDNGSLMPSVKNRIVEWNGFKFKFNTFSHAELREIQLSLIETEILQAVGRNRILRNDCVTHLYSNLPLKVTTSFDW